MRIFILISLLLASCAYHESFVSVPSPKPSPTILGAFGPTDCFYNSVASTLNATTLYTISYAAFYENGVYVTYSELYSDSGCTNAVLNIPLKGTYEVIQTMQDSKIYKLDQVASGGLLLYGEIKIKKEGLTMRVSTTPVINPNDAEIFAKRVGE